MRRLLAVPAIAATAATLAACSGPTFSSLPLPGNSVNDPVKVSAPFDEALNLQKGASVRINGVDLGRVTDVTVSNFHANVKMSVQKSAHLHQGATARLRYTTPLGELYVDVTNPATGTEMADGSSFAAGSTNTAPTVEDALASASTLINGGGLNQLQVIVTEANRALGGHEQNLRGVINQTVTAEQALNASSANIDKALNSLNAASLALGSRKQIIHDALQTVGPAAQSLTANVDNLTQLLASLNQFGGTANAFVNQTKSQILQTVTTAQPLLQEMANNDSTLAPTLQAVITGSHLLDRAVPGDYLNLFVTLALQSTSLSTTASNLALGGAGGGAGILNLPGVPNPTTLLGGATSGASPLGGVTNLIGGLL